MEDCKCGRIPPCYGGKKFRIHEELEEIKPCSEETAQGVIEALRNASELNKVSNRLAEHIFEDILKSIKSNDMEEKKTKKMTKAEAFEHLRHKKVNSKGMVKEIQKKLFEIGYTWCDGSTDIFFFVGFFLIDDETFQFTESLSHFRNCAYEEISADDILSIEIVDEKQCSKEDGLDLIITVGARLSEVLRRMEGHKHVIITETTVSLYDEGMRLFHSDPVLDYDR